MSLSSALSGFFSGLSTKTDGDKETITHGWIGSSRFLIVAVVLGALGYVAIMNIRDVLTNNTLVICFFATLNVVVVSYLGFNSWTKNHATDANAAIIKERQRLAWADGTLTEIEASSLKTADANAESANAVVGVVNKGATATASVSSS